MTSNKQFLDSLAGQRLKGKMFRMKNDLMNRFFKVERDINGTYMVRLISGKTHGRVVAQLCVTKTDDIVSDVSINGSHSTRILKQQDFVLA
jgi:hypothetical protein